jgi:ATP-dependent Clp protease ATP-binding subunit ClpB
MIIIATSNAASDIIIATPSADLYAKKTEIIDQIISRGIFRPELINRFDGVIFFHPLTNDNLGNVAKLMLQDLSKRMKEKGIELVVTDDLISVLMEKGSDAKFGARPMNRAIADLVEEKIAQGLISGTIKPGSEVKFFKTAEGNLEIQN